MCRSVSIGVLACVWACEGQRLILGAFFSHCPSYAFETVSLSEPETH